MACLMKRTPCCVAISPSSCGSMMTKRDLSYSKCRSISGSVPLPIEPKPIMTMGPEIFARIFCSGGLIQVYLRNMNCAGGNKGSGGAPLRGDFDLDLHLGLVEPGDDEEGCGRPDIAEPFAANGQHGVGVACIGDVIGGAHDIGHGEAAIP